MLRILALAILFVSLPALAGPVAPPGDIGLRHDIQMLADYGAIRSPTMAWPMAWDAILADLEAAQAEELNLPVSVRGTYVRVLERARRATARNDARFNARISASEKPTRIRGFTNAPYEEGELSAGFSWANKHLSLDINATGAYEPLDDKEARADGSHVRILSLQETWRDQKLESQHLFWLFEKSLSHPIWHVYLGAANLSQAQYIRHNPFF